jgi:hypothetical protein
VPGDDWEAFLAELRDIGVDRRIRPIDADGIVFGAGEGGFGKRQRRGNIPIGGARIADDFAGVAEVLAIVEDARLRQPVHRMVLHRLQSR